MDKIFFNLSDDSNDNTSEIKKILAQQSELLKRSTKGVVRGKFGKIKNVFTLSAFGVLQSALSKAAIKENIYDDNKENDEYTADLEDANTLYEENMYGYEIFSQQYKFRIFEMKLCPIFPVKMRIDAGILEDLVVDGDSRFIFDEKTDMYVINSIKQFENILETILSNRKVTYIIKRMIELAEKDT